METAPSAKEEVKKEAAKPAVPQPPKVGKNPKAALTIFSVITLILLVACGVLGFFYWRQAQGKAELEKEKQALQAQVDSFTQEQGKAIETEKTASESAKAETDSYKAKIAKALLYNNVFKYVNGLIETHGGFTGWTQDEFSTGRALADKTKDASYLAVIDAAWNQQAIPPLTRVINFFKATAQAIETSLK